MKNFIIWLSLIFVLVFTVKMNTAITKEQILALERQSSIEKAVSDAMEQIKVAPRYMISTDDELVAEFIKTLFSLIETSEGIQVNILTADAENGILDVAIIYGLGNGKDVTVRRTAIINE